MARAGGSMSQGEFERQLRWLMTVRVAIVTTLLISAFSIELLFNPAQSLRPVFLLAAGSYGMVLIYAVLDRWLRGTRSFIFLQLVGDALVITMFVHITGGLDSPMSFLYLLPISVASMLLYRNGALIMAGVSFAAYAGLIVFGAAWSLIGSGMAGPFDHEPGRVTYFLVAHLVAMVAVALLSAYLSERLRSQGRELDERRGAVARLQALNENIIESINSGLVTTTLSGRINFINRGGTEIIGLRHSEVEGRTVESVLQLDEGFLQAIRRRLLAERRFRFERWFETQEGQRIFLGLAVSNLYDKIGRPLGYIFIFQDLTDIHALEQEVRLKERMAALGEMAAGMAHELRNPLAAISGAVQYLKGDIGPQGETLELMDIILRESDRLDQTIRDFLTFTRPGSFAAESTDIVRLLQDNLKLLRKSRECREAHRIVTRFAAPRMVCEVDPNRMKQIFWNLATNALKAMPEGGTLSIDVRWVGAGERVEFLFSDNGVGMDEQQQRLYFQPFNSSFPQGTGLGTAIIYRLVEEHDGKIHLKSDAGSGTCVRIELPRHQTSAEAGRSVSYERKVAGGKFR
jgi:two-component system sensor histidine kinase PilS (NtrC family)